MHGWQMEEFLFKKKKKKKILNDILMSHKVSIIMFSYIAFSITEFLNKLMYKIKWK